MKTHVKIYFDFFDLDTHDSRHECELTEQSCVLDIHHIQRRGMGGNPAMDRIENLIGINRKDHEYLGEKNHFKSMLYRKHMKHLERSGKPYDKAWIIQQIEKYD